LITLDVFPIPADNILNIQLSQNRGGAFKVLIYNGLGVLVGEKNYSQRNDARLDVGHLVPGFYFLEAIIDGQRLFYDFIKI